MSNEMKIPLPRSLQEIVGSLLFASETPLTPGDLRSAVHAVEPEEGENAEVMDVYRTCTNREIQEALQGLEKALDVAGCGFKLVCTAGTYRLQTSPSCGRYVRAMLKLDRPNRLGRASLETLAIVAYRQPITKSEVEEIRGVDVSGNIKTLMDLQLIRLVGKSELPGHPFLYGTTPLFLEHFGLASLQQLNELDPTLQRSNPKEKAASYKKPVAAEETIPPQEEPVPVVKNQGESDESGEASPGEQPKDDIAVSGAGELSKSIDSSSSDDDVFIAEIDDEDSDEDDIDIEDEDIVIDDEEDEFDDEDDDEEDEFDDEDDEEEDADDEEI